MTEPNLVGNNWPKHRLPGGLYDQWREKEEKAEKADAKKWPIVSNADFTNYERIYLGPADGGVSGKNIAERDQVLPGCLYDHLAYLAHRINFGDALYLSQQPLEQPKISAGDTNHVATVSHWCQFSNVENPIPYCEGVHQNTVKNDGYFEGCPVFRVPIRWTQNEAIAELPVFAICWVPPKGFVPIGPRTSDKPQTQAYPPSRRPWKFCDRLEA